MSGHGFIDPSAGERERLIALEAKVNLILSTLDRSALSSEALDLLMGVEAGDWRAARDLRALFVADPLPTAPTTQPAVPVVPSDGGGL